jgi:hypothetical protein
MGSPIERDLMPRKLRRNDTNSIVTVHSFAMTRNMWEYFFLDPKPNSAKNMCAIVYGNECEMGDVHIPEIEPHLMTVSRDLADLAPPPGWEWVE